MFHHGFFRRLIFLAFGLLTIKQCLADLAEESSSRFSCTLTSDVDFEVDEVTCAGDFNKAANLDKAVEDLLLKNKNTSANAFFLERSRLDILPSNLFRHLPQLRILVVSETELRSLGMSKLGPTVFEVVKKSLERLEVYETNTVSEWNWAIMPRMDNMKTLIIEKSRLRSVKEVFGLAPDLRTLELRRAEIEYVDPNAFRTNFNLTFCSLAQNRISKLSRSMFPKPANKLWSLDLSGNEIDKLPKDMFSDMPSLKELQLGGNRLRSFTPIQIVFKNLNILWLQGNQLKCDKICWMFRSQYEPDMWDITRTLCQKKFMGFTWKICLNWLWESEKVQNTTEQMETV